jgi:hypothetical protein
MSAELTEYRLPRRHAASLPRLHEPPEATSLFVILIPIIAGRALHATRALRAGLDPKFRPALLASLISSRNFEPLPVPQVAFRTLQPSGNSMYQNDAQI